MFYVYILYSISAGKYYCGQTNNISSRLQRHNSGETKSIRHGIPWKLEGYILKYSRSEAVELELKIKKRGISRWLHENEFSLIRPE